MRILSLNFWINALASTAITMICIYLIKKANDKVNIPFVSDVVDAV